MKKMHEKERVAQDPEMASQGTNCTQEEPEGEPEAETQAAGRQAPPDANDVPNFEDAIPVDAQDEPEVPGSDGECEREAMDVDPVMEIPDVSYPRFHH